MNHVALAPHLRGCDSRFTDTRSKGLSRCTRTLLLLCTLALSACDGGGDPPPDPPATEAVWDQSNWDEKNWQ